MTIGWPLPSDKSVIWTIEDQLKAVASGWCLRRTGPTLPEYYIARRDSHRARFDIALQRLGGLVLRRSIEGHELCAKAMRFVEETSPLLMDYYTKMMCEPEPEDRSV